MLPTSSYFTTLILSLLIFRSTAVPHSDPSSTSVFIEGTSCLLLYSESNSTFTFLKCKIHNDDTYNPWSTCFPKCCPSMPQGDYSIPSLSTLQDCQLNNQEAQFKVVIVIMILLALLFGLVMLCCCCLIIWKISRQITLSRMKVGNDINTTVVDVQWSEQNVFNADLSQDMKWSKNAIIQNSLQIKQDSCSICLEEEPTAELICKHRFHPQCIGVWFHKSTACPFCRHVNIKGIKIYCQRCRWRYMVCTRTLLSNHGSELPLICKNCECVEMVHKGSLQELMEGSHVVLKEQGINQINIQSKTTIEEERIDY